MLFTESQLQMVSNPMAVLNEATYLNEDEATIRPQTIPVSENTRIGAYTVRFDDVHRLAENHGIDYVSAMVAIAESADVDPAYLKVAVDEAEVICDPEIIMALPEASVVIAPLSESSLAFQYVTECINLWDQMPDTDEADLALAEALINDTYLEQFINEAINEAGTTQPQSQSGPGVFSRIGNAAGKVGDFFTRDFKAAGKNWKNLGRIGEKLQGRVNSQGELDSQDPTNQAMAKAGAANIKAGIKNVAKGTGKAAAAVAGTAAVIAGARKLLSVKDQPKSFLGQKIAALRKIYQAWMQKAEKGGPGAGAKIKQAAAKLLSIIDALMAKMQKMAG